MLDYLPGYYATSLVMQSLLNAQGTELDDLRLAVEDTLNQFFVNSATWGLDIWEQELAIPTDITKPISQRRSLLMSKIRGTGTVTVELLHTVAQSYDRGSIDVVEEPSLYRFTVRFIDTLGLPPNLDDLKSAIEAIKPAHLAVQFAYRYLNISEVQKMTIQQIQNHPLTDFAPFLDA
ncbi:YmfQ family protein [Cohnella nanjingensis]|uniref:YmfQ family protein n=1 Tax=Cohnella nanjingensis TaxID=1387779 RepID=A0A7X0RVQ8_9BACL|nr:YmfQ family protein [Cohnella nanjingensis]MBB6674503.1 YmfQ family protein [Cohnella nanjingensis]